MIRQYRCKKKLDKDLEGKCGGPLKVSLSVRRSATHTGRITVTVTSTFSTVRYMLQLYFGHLQTLIITQRQGGHACTMFALVLDTLYALRWSK